MKKIKFILFLLLFVLAQSALIIYGNGVKESLKDAILICGNSLIPALLPFCFISSLIINSGMIFSLKGKVVPYFLFILSQFSGYPIGAKLCELSVKNGLFSKEDAQKILPSMVCAGPSFIINIVGMQIFGSKEIGIRLFIIQIFTNLLIFIFLNRKGITSYSECKEISFSKAITSSVESSINSVILICAYIIIFSSVTPIITSLLSEKASNLFLYVFEVTGGVFASENIYITVAVLSWGGVCVMLQIKGLAMNLNISLLKIALFRAIAAVLSVIFLKISFLMFPISAQTITNLTEKPTLTLGGNIGFVSVFVLCIVVMLLSLKKRITGKLYEDII